MKAREVGGVSVEVVVQTEPRTLAVFPIMLSVGLQQDRLLRLFPHGTSLSGGDRGKIYA